MYNVIDLSKYIVSKCVRDNFPISNMQLQKILYYIQKEFLRCGELAFDATIEAWTFGAVVPEVYYYFCGFGAMPITSVYDNILIDERVDFIIERKRTLNPWEMVEDAHNPDKAWAKVYNNGEGKGQVIPVTLIQKDNTL